MQGMARAAWALLALLLAACALAVTAHGDEHAHSHALTENDSLDALRARRGTRVCIRLRRNIAGR